VYLKEGDLKYLNDLYYLDVEARAWQPVTADNAPAARHSHSAVLDTQRMWVFGGHVGFLTDLNDLHYFDVEARHWHPVAAANACICENQMIRGGRAPRRGQ